MTSYRIQTLFCKLWMFRIVLPCGHLMTLYKCITVKSCVNTYSISLLHPAKRMDTNLGMNGAVADVNGIDVFYIYRNLVTSHRGHSTLASVLVTTIYERH